MFEKLAECYAEVYDAYTNETGSQYYCDDEPNYLSEYDAALPDDLPVIPKEIGEYIERQKQGSTLRSAIIDATDFHAVDDDKADWIFYHSETFAHAWLLGVWRVEETGEIVKLEAEK
ncbi:hypothetical protein FC74_GL002273 [Lacticaseibacillus paracasei subsp. paracasei ATCC 25302 = DSM 5622 = JCM 8130]|nr:hypothetical protein FC74_GL002273 [Lacticaseibacillus paracasei subsp. paracasei ATCC 25302 = DSM 5622 = JCM 8130]